ncbi:hypothetical protein [Clostridium simiarum]|uniref:hypothetical protein n=1 Tax=Clostridium simiarum TaxID=2841506 RepID=UPI001FEB4644|nr:hypothetical protein [Clostridium simiarum]
MEVTVGKIATAIISKLRHYTFYSLPELKIAVASALKSFNEAIFKNVNIAEQKYLWKKETT